MHYALYLLELVQLILEQGHNSIILAAFTHPVCLATKLFHICSDGFQDESYLQRKGKVSSCRPMATAKSMQGCTHPHLLASFTYM